MSSKLDLAVDVANGRVVIMFGQRVQNFSLTPRDAHQFADFIKAKADEAGRGLAMPADEISKKLLLPPGYKRRGQ